MLTLSQPHVCSLCVLVCSSLLLIACGRYEEFTLPIPAQPGVATASYRVEPSPAPLLTRGAPGEWDAVDVLNPSVVFQHGTYYNFYSGYDGSTWHTGLATSADGLQWTKQGKLLSPDPRTWEGSYIAANGSALFYGGQWLYWYQAGRPAQIGLARSADGRHWRKEPAPVLPLGPRGSWDERAAADPYVVAQEGRLYCFYLGMDRARRQRLGVATSSDGLVWSKLRANPVLELGEAGAFDEAGLGEPAVWQAGGWYWMLYTGRDRQERRRMGLARSRDGVHWHRTGNEPFFAGAQPWNREVVCDPSADPRGGSVRVWYGGGDLPRPDENIHGQVGVFRLIPIHFSSKDSALGQAR